MKKKSKCPKFRFRVKCRHLGVHFISCFPFAILNPLPACGLDHQFNLVLDYFYLHDNKGGLSRMLKKQLAQPHVSVGLLCQQEQLGLHQVVFLIYNPVTSITAVLLTSFINLIIKCFLCKFIIRTTFKCCVWEGGGRRKGGHILRSIFLFLYVMILLIIC